MKQGITIGQLASRSGLSRATLLYYDRLGLLRPQGRSGGNYRLYAARDAARLDQICIYRGMGIPLKQIVRMLDQTVEAGHTQDILRHRLAVLDRQIDSLHDQQRQILRLLERLPSRKPSLHGGKSVRSARARPTDAGKSDTRNKESAVINKRRWVEIMTAAGFDEQDQQNWHRQFEKMEPEVHQEFLESLGIDAGEIAKIREWSRK
jgi:MerR family transcriptional regulator, thiopeptide resistance regulator